MFLTKNDVAQLGFCTTGENVLIDSKAVFINPCCISIGHDVRIDAFCIISAGVDGVSIGNYIHLGAGVMIFGGGGQVRFEDFSNLSSRVSVFSVSDDFSGESLTNPMTPDEYKHLHKGPVTFNRHAIIGCGSVIMPGVTIGNGAAVGALSFVNKDLPDFAIGAGTPVRIIGRRSTTLLQLEKKFLSHDQREKVS